MPLINLTDVLQTEGMVLHCQEKLTIDRFDLPFGRFPIIESSPLDLTVTNKKDGKLLLEGQISLEVEIPCARCLDPVRTPIPVSFEFDVDMKLSEEERLQALEESDFLHGYNLDVDKLVCGEALLNWPMQVLCREDCAGLCKVCGQNLNRKACSCDRTDLDPRMAKIRDIFSMYKEV